MNTRFQKALVAMVALVGLGLTSMLYAEPYGGEYQNEPGQEEVCQDEAYQTRARKGDQFRQGSRGGQRQRGSASSEEDGQYNRSDHHGKGKDMDKLAEELGLTQEQQQQLKEQRSENRENMKQTREALQAKRQQLRQEVRKEAVNQEAINKLIAEIGDLTEEQLKQRIGSIVSMKQILTPEQYTKLQEKHKQNGHDGSRKFHKGSKKRGNRNSNRQDTEDEASSQQNQ